MSHKETPQPSRRDVLKRGGVAAAVTLTNPLLVLEALSKLQEESNRRKKTEFKSLKEFLKFIKPERKRIWSILEKNTHNIFSGIKNLTRDQIGEDFTLYYPLYKAGEIKYAVPWYLLWTIHEAETAASRDEYPARNGYRGAMQLDPMHYKKEEITRAPQGFEFLDGLDQRYSQKKGWATNDWEEILRAASFIRMVAKERYPTTKREAGILAVVENNYSANGSSRVRKYWELQQLFYPSPTSSPTPTKSSTT